MGELVGPLASRGLQLDRDRTFARATRILRYLAAKVNEELGGPSALEEPARTAEELGHGCCCIVLGGHTSYPLSPHSPIFGVAPLGVVLGVLAVALVEEGG